MNLFKTLVAGTLVVTVPLNGGCATWTARDLARQEDYQRSEGYVRQGMSSKALDAFPAKEPGGFITSLEKAWLMLLSGRGDPGPLLAIADQLEARKTLSVSGEAKSFFYVEAEDGYFPAEHEAVLLHLVLGTIFMRQGDAAKARVEAKRASRYLEGQWGPGADFDDAYLRLWSAALWLYVDEWDHARVDLRRAMALDARLAPLASVADSSLPPPGMQLFFAGSGPSIDWEPSFKSLDGSTHVEFSLAEAVPAVALRDASTDSIKSLTSTLSVSSALWYSRHQERNSSIKSVLAGSKYMASATVGSAAAGSAYAAGSIGNLLLVHAGIFLGSVLIVGSVYSMKAIGEAAAAGGAGPWAVVLAPIMGIGGGIMLIVKSADAYAENQRAIERASGGVLDAAVNPARVYRFVRFMPDWLTATVGPVAVEAPLAVYGSETGRPPFVDAKSAKGTVVRFYSEIADQRFAALDGVKGRQWQDPTTGRLWTLLSEPLVYKDVAAACAKQKLKLASVEDVIGASEAGLMDAGAVGEALDSSYELWVSPQGDVDRGTCPYMRVGDSRESVTVECGSGKIALCHGDAPSVTDDVESRVEPRKEPRVEPRD